MQFFDKKNPRNSAIRKNAKIIFVEVEMFSWYRSCLLKAFDSFKELQNRIREISF